MKFDTTKYKIWTWSHPMMLHWIINPGTAVLELFGQRIPKILLIERNSSKSFMEKTLIPCPHCETLHSGLTWTPQNKTAFKNWFGLYCPSCGKTIPCLINITTIVILLLTAPFWYFFKGKLRELWLSKQAPRYQNIDLTSPHNPFAGNGWIRQGASWGFTMFLLMDILNPLLFGDGLSIKRMALGVCIWLSGGLLFGLCMKAFMHRMNKV